MASIYDVEDPKKVQGRDEVRIGERNLGALRLERAVDALSEVNGRILLLGCGAGRYARALVRHLPGRIVIGGDLSRRALSEAVAVGAGPHYLAFDAQELPFIDESFDAVLFLDVLEHVPNPDQLLGECARVLKPGGVLHYFLPLEDEPGTLYRLFRRNWPVPIHRWKRDHVGHIQRFTRGDVLRRTWSVGLQVETTGYSFHLVGQLHDILDYWHRERAAGADGILPLAAVEKITRIAFVATWRLAYLEDRFYDGPRFASGIHVTARKPSCREGSGSLPNHPGQARLSNP